MEALLLHCWKRWRFGSRHLRLKFTWSQRQDLQNTFAEHSGSNTEQTCSNLDNPPPSRHFDPLTFLSVSNIRVATVVWRP